MSLMRTISSASRFLNSAVLLLLIPTLASAPLAWAQSRVQNQAQSQSQPASQQQPATQPPQPADQSSPSAGGPEGDNGAIALPRKDKSDVPAPAPAAPTVKNPPELSNYSLRVDVPEVSVDVGVLLEKTGQFVPNLKPDNFRVYENGVEQKVIGFKRVEAPITALMVCEFAATNYYFIYDMRNAAWAFAQQLRPQDYVALMTFDMRTRIELDFTQDKNQLLNAINSLIIPGFSEPESLRRPL